MAKKPETIIVEAIQTCIYRAGGDSYHVHGSIFQRLGEPDIDGWLPYKDGFLHLKVEVKTPTGTPSKLQEHRVKVYKAAGYCAGIVYSVDQFKELVNAFCGYTRLP